MVAGDGGGLDEECRQRSEQGDEELLPGNARGASSGEAADLFSAKEPIIRRPGPGFFLSWGADCPLALPWAAAALIGVSRAPGRAPSVSLAIIWHLAHCVVMPSAVDYPTRLAPGL